MVRKAITIDKKSIENLESISVRIYANKEVRIKLEDARFDDSCVPLDMRIDRV